MNVFEQMLYFGFFSQNLKYCTLHDVLIGHRYKASNSNYGINLQYFSFSQTSDSQLSVLMEIHKSSLCMCAPYKYHFD